MRRIASDPSLTCKSGQLRVHKKFAHLPGPLPSFTLPSFLFTCCSVSVCRLRLHFLPSPPPSHAPFSWFFLLPLVFTFLSTVFCGALSPLFLSFPYLFPPFLPLGYCCRCCCVGEGRCVDGRWCSSFTPLFCTFFVSLRSLSPVRYAVDASERGERVRGASTPIHTPTHRSTARWTRMPRDSMRGGREVQ